MPTDRTTARQLLAELVDPDSFQTWDTTPHPPFSAHGAIDEGYAAELNRARERSGADESVITGEALIAGQRVALALGEFNFLAGSVGVSAAHRLVEAIERATRERLALVTSPTSGGTRMQEGTVAFVQMVAIAAALAEHRAAGLFYATYLRNPTTGGVFASWGSLAQVTAAEPGALIGFLGPRVYEAIHGEAFPDGVQQAENLQARGIIDAVVPAATLRPWLIPLLDVARGNPPVPPGGATGPSETPVPSGPGSETQTWDAITRTRSRDRLGARDLIAAAGADVTTLSGTGAGETDPAVLLALLRLDGVASVLVAQDRAAGVSLGPAGLRIAQRGMRLARELNLPLVTVIDTEGAELSVAAEEGALAGEIARCLATQSTLPVPVVSLLLGSGTGGGAIALLPADRVLAATSSWLAPLPPEGASVIRYRTPDWAPEIAHAQGVAAGTLAQFAVVDRLVAEPADPAELMSVLGAVLGEELRQLLTGDAEARRAQRRRRYRAIGASGEVSTGPGA